MYYIIVSPILGDVIVRSIINIFSNDLLIGTPFSLIIIRLNLISSFSRSLVPIEFSYIKFYFELYVLKLSINIILSVIIPFQLISFIVRLFLTYIPKYIYPRFII